MRLYNDRADITVEYVEENNGKEGVVDSETTLKPVHSLWRFGLINIAEKNMQRGKSRSPVTNNYFFFLCFTSILK